MKSLLLATALILSYSAFSATKIDGVPYNCLKDAPKAMIENYIKENSPDQEDLREYKKTFNDSPAYLCRHRDNLKQESFDWCDGNGCTGIQAEFKNGKCSFSEFWTGQDDQDGIDEEEYKQNCLTKDDF